jgi:valyl-tRNA synthetase
MTELPKTFDPAAIEAKWYAHWEETNAFRPARPDAPPFTIVMPPPNVTGSLHIGHALDITLQDVLVRHARLQGKDALWVAGTDHAGIATQMVVERQMALHQDKRTNYAREDFVQKVWDWKAESGGQITQQLRRLGASCDWENERFTMDPGFSKAVIKVFVDLYNEGLLYRDKRLVNWDPALKTAISDLEVESREVDGHMWHFKYPLSGGETYRYVERDAEGKILFEEERDYIAIATTRPETMLGDGAVAVHPGDQRYAAIVGKLCEIPVGPKAHRRLIPIITDEYPDPDFGSGAVKITGAHDQNDYGVAQRNGIPMYRLMDETATMRADGLPYAAAAERAKAIAVGALPTPAEIDALNLVPDVYRGLDRYEARKRVIADIDAEGLMLCVEDKKIMQPFGDRSGVVIEPMLTDQWYVDAKTLAGPAIEAVRSGAIKVVPQTWEKTWFQWLENIQPWCVSRQLWWGHRIPAWYGDDGKIYVAENEAGATAQAGQGVTLRQDEDVLDTWFSSALWPFGTLGWPDGDHSSPPGGGAERSEAEGALPHLAAPPPSALPTPPPGGEERQNALLAKHYPNDVLISGFDILFFWDARMAMQGLHFMKDVPWKTLYLHGLVRAPDGSKMSKSKGNTVDPLGLIDQYGADALRFTLAAMESQGRDIKLDEQRVVGYRNFATKLWNAARFLQGNGVGASTSVAAPEATLAVNKWIIGEVVETLAKLDAAFADLRYDAMADAIYHFAWGTFCDWYIELVKGAFDDETRAVAAWAFDQILVMLHPFMPFITEELWHATGVREDGLIHAHWPKPNAIRDLAAAADIERLKALIVSVRALRNDLNVPASALIRLILQVEDRLKPLDDFHTTATNYLRRMARVESVEQVGWPSFTVTVGIADSDDAETRQTVRNGAAQFSSGDQLYLLPLEGIIDLTAERARLAKSAEAAEKEASSLAARLANPAFVEKAKPEAIGKARADHAEKSAEAERLRAALARLG